MAKGSRPPSPVEADLKKLGVKLPKDLAKNRTIVMAKKKEKEDVVTVKLVPQLAQMLVPILAKVHEAKEPLSDAERDAVQLLFSATREGVIRYVRGG